MRLDPVARSAHVALGQLLHAAGDSAQAADVVERLLTAGADRERTAVEVRLKGRRAELTARRGYLRAPR